MASEYQPLQAQEVLAAFAGPITIWVGDTLPDLDIYLSYDSGGYVDLEPPTPIIGHLSGPMNGVDDPVVFSLHAGEGALFPLTPPAPQFHVSIDSETLNVTGRVGDVLTAQRAQEGTLIAAHLDDSSVQLQVLTQVMCYISHYRGTKMATSGVCQIIDPSKGHAIFQSSYVWRTPGLYEGQVRIRFGTDPPGYDYLSSQKFLIHVRPRTPDS